MAGKLFPETYIGDSEDVCKKTPTGKKHAGPQRDVKSASPSSTDTECHDIDHLADSAELKELACQGEVHPDGETHGNKERPTEQTPGSHPAEEGEGGRLPQKPQFMNLLDFRWLQEKEDEEAGQDNSISALGDASSQEACTKTLVSDVQEGLWPPPGGNTEEHLEHRVNEVSLIDSFEPNGKLTPSTGFSRADCPEGSPVDQEGYYLCDEEAFLKESSASTGYFPCYRTYMEFPRYQPHSAEEEPQGKGSGDTSVQCDGCLQDEARSGEKRGAEANNNMKEVKRVAAPHEASRGPPLSSARPGSGGRKPDGPGGRRVRPHGDGAPEASSRRKEQGVPKPCAPGGPPCRSSPRISPAKEGPGPPSGSVPLPTAGVARKSPQKRKHRACQADEKEQATISELKPLLQDQRSLPPSPEEKVGALSICCYGMEAAGESSQVMPAKERGKEPTQRESATQSCRVVPETPSPASEPRTTSSRLSFHSIVSWVWRLFRRPPQPSTSTSTSTSTGTETGRRPLTSRLRLWITQHSSRVTPEPP